MRGKAPPARHRAFLSGITPAYAGKRVLIPLRCSPSRDHPRVCGEKPVYHVCLEAQKGSPPRMRGKVQGTYITQRYIGITPAYAGKSAIERENGLAVRDHPRVCGEKFTVNTVSAWCLGSPPRMRGKGIMILSLTHTTGITPAYAGKSTLKVLMKMRRWDHPRVCGEKKKNRA